MDINVLIQKAESADKEAFLQFKNEYFDTVKAVASEVLKEEEEAELSADLTLRNAYKLLGNGVNPAVLDPWLSWLAREDALEILNHRRSLIRQEMMLKSGNLLDLYDSTNSSTLFANPEDWRLLGEPDDEDDDLDDLFGDDPLDQLTDSESSDAEEAAAEPETVPEKKEEEAVVAPVTETDDAEVSERMMQDEPVAETSEASSEETVKEPEFEEIPAAEIETSSDDYMMEFVTDDDFEDEKSAKKHKKGIVILKILEVILVLLLIWCIIGFARSYMQLPFEILDLGYTWFNEHLFPLFGVVSDSFQNPLIRAGF